MSGHPKGDDPHKKHERPLSFSFALLPITGTGFLLLRNALLCLSLFPSILFGEKMWRDDPSVSEVDGRLKPGSEVHLYLPNLPYLGISHDINGALLRPAENDKGEIELKEAVNKIIGLFN